MWNRAKILIIIYAVLLITGIIVVNSIKSEIEFSLPTDITRSFSNTKILPVEQESFFLLMTNVENYPVVLPKYVKSISVINRTENSLGGLREFYQIEVKGFEISTSFLVLQDTQDNRKSDGTLIQKITILNGDAESTQVVQTFRKHDLGTELFTQSTLRLKGILIPIGLLPPNNIEMIYETLIDDFVKFLLPQN